MDNKLIKREDISVFTKVMNFIKKIFYKKEYKDTEVQLEEINNSMQDDLKNNISDKSDINSEKEYFLNEIEKNPGILNNLSNDRLDKLIEYYEKTIKETQDKINKLKYS